MQLRTIGLLTGMFAAALAIPAQAFTALQNTYISESGKTTILIELMNRDSLKLGSVMGRYKQVGGSGGRLLSLGGMISSRQDGFYANFQDTEGSERCVGRLKLLIDHSQQPNPATAIWDIDGTVPGSRCSTVGQTITLKMRATR